MSPVASEKLHSRPLSFFNVVCGRLQRANVIRKEDLHKRPQYLQLQLLSPLGLCQLNNRFQILVDSGKLPKIQDSMRYFSAVLMLLITVAFCWFLDHSRTPSVPLGFGRVLDPFGGFWQNMESEDFHYAEEIDLPGLQNKVTVHLDERGVPHVFAENDKDLYMAQGYVTARDRLWQMEFQVFAAGGRISELVHNPRALELDRQRRRTGMLKAAEDNLAHLEQFPDLLAIMNAYTAGVNAWIDDLSFADYPLEYKLMDYSPEPWTNLKQMLLLKFMAWDLTGRSEDFENTNAYLALDEGEFAQLFPYYTDSIRTIIPTEMVLDSGSVATDSTTGFSPREMVSKLELPSNPHPNNGSNNWVVSGKKTASGNPILCNDPHLGLRLPSIWYEIQLSTPEHNVYGVSLPGAPYVIIGFNGDVAWGVTNASRDVLDWYQIEFQDDTKKAYKHDGKWIPVETRIEEIKRRGRETYLDTVLYTLHGPVVYDETFRDRDSAGPLNVAMKWEGLAADQSIRTFYQLNRAKSYDDYRKAISYYACPGQNFIFASRSGDIAITQQGRFPIKAENQGLFVMDGSNPEHLWQGTIPFEENPTAKNPERGYLFSSNQMPVSEAYPYRADGYYDDTRNRRIDKELARMTNVKVEDMQQLQNDNYNIEAAEVLPRMLAKVDPSRLSAEAKIMHAELSKWDHYNTPEQISPSYFEFWADRITADVWKDEMAKSPYPARYPDRYFTLQWLSDSVPFRYADDIQTNGIETSGDLLASTLEAAAKEMEAWKAEEGVAATWQNVNDVSITHLARLAPFSRTRVNTGGNHSIVNANFAGHGPSWRMVVELGPEPNAYGVYPGGQSGNPGSPLFDNMIDPWAAGQYFRLNYFKRGVEPGEAAKFSQTLNPDSK
jgi:penicillin amidase